MVSTWKQKSLVFGLAMLMAGSVLAVDSGAASAQQGVPGVRKTLRGRSFNPFSRIRSGRITVSRFGLPQLQPAGPAAGAASTLVEDQAVVANNVSQEVPLASHAGPHGPPAGRPPFRPPGRSPFRPPPRPPFF